MLITKEISKAARGLVGWSANNLAVAAGISPDTIRSFESGRTRSLSAENQDAVKKALEAAGVQFLESGDAATGPGVALKN
ncbi:helix-turn-helix domain-containing protein [Aliiroseovarius crassostreae]|uniref:helix-turn-helix domain-containing protein n=1 Tax=Aliiroseovarius crassostreae TaxID=154981 RepID=UPI003C7EC684